MGFTRKSRGLPPRSWRRRLLVGLALTAALLPALAALLLATPVRGPLLEWAIARLGNSLPGTLRIDGLSWPRLGRLEGRGLLWTAGKDTLCSAGGWTLDLEISPLLARDLHVRELSLLGLTLDLPALRRAFPADAGGEAKGSGFLRPGGLPFLPSLSIDRLRIEGGPLRLDSLRTLTLVRLSGSFEARATREPSLSVILAQVESASGGGGLQGDSLLWQPTRGQLRGRLALRTAEGWRLRISLDSPTTDRIDLRALLGDSLRTTAELVLQAGLLRVGGEWQGARVAGSLFVAEDPLLRRVTGPGPARKGHPDWAAVDARLSGTLRWRPDLAVELTLLPRTAGWLEEFHVRLRSSAGAQILDSLSLRLLGVDVAGRGRLDQDSLRADLALSLVESSDLRAAFPSAGIPEDLQARLHLHMAGGLALASIRTDLTLQAETAGLGLAMSAQVRGQDKVLVDTLHVRDLALSRSPVPSNGGGRLIRAATGGWRAEPLVLTGDLGRLELRGVLDSLWRGPVSLNWNLGGISPTLGDWLGLPDSTRRALSQVLSAGPPMSISLRGRATGTGPGGGMAATGELHVPGPARLACLLPAGARLTELEDLTARWSMDWRRGSGGAARWRGALQAEAPGWLDELRVDLAGNGGMLRADTLRLRMMGLAVEGRGAWSSSGLELNSHWNLVDLSLPARLFPALADVDVGLEGVLVASGPIEDLRLDLRANGHAGRQDLVLPDLRLAALRDEHGLRAVCWAPDGLRAGGLLLDSLSARYSGPAGPGALLLPGRLWLRESGIDQALEAELEIRREAGWRLDGRQTALRVGDGKLASRRPFRLHLFQSGGVLLDSLDLAGNLGSLSLSAMLVPDSLASRLDLQADLQLGAMPWLSNRVAGSLPGRLKVQLAAAGRRLDGRLSMDSLVLRTGQVLDLKLKLGGGLDGPSLTAWVASAGDTMMRATGRLPLRLSLWPPSAAPDLDQLALEVDFDRLPLLAATAPWEESGLPDLRLSGQVQVGGSAAAPRVGGMLRVDATNDAHLAGYEASINLDMSPLDSLRQGSLLVARLDLTRLGRPLAHGDLSLPLVTMGQGGTGFHPGLLKASLTAQDLDLEDLNPLLPEDLWLDGRGDLELGADGPLANPALSGQTRLTDLDLRRSDGTHLFGRARFAIAGPARHPRVSGWLEVENGEARLPDLPQNLHDSSGPSLLWQMRARQDSLTETPTSRGSYFGDSLDLDIELRIPNRMRVVGGDLDLIIRGRVTLKRMTGRTELLGDTQVLSGEFRLLGRQFTVQSGTMTWFGDETLAPRLDIELAATAGNTRVIIHLTGTLQQPVLDLRSEPPLEEGEIMALLLFSRSTSELDNQQQDMLQQQATQVAADYGMAALNARLSRTLHLDLLRWEAGGLEGQGTLLVGKYLGPRVLLRYEQSLSQQDLYRLNVDYVLSRHLRLDTSTGSRGQSGIALNWSRVW